MMRIPDDGRPRSTKNVFVFKTGDRYFSGIRVPVNLRRYRTVDALLDELTVKVPGLNRGARVLSTSRGKHCIDQLDQLEHLGRYFCSDRPPRIPRFVRKKAVSNPIDYEYRGAYGAARFGNASKTNSKATLSNKEGTVTTNMNDSPTSVPRVPKQKRTKSLPPRNYNSDSSKAAAPSPKQQKKKKIKKKKTAATKYEIAEIKTSSDSAIESAQTTLSDVSALSISPLSMNPSSVALNAVTEESFSERAPSRTQSDPGSLAGKAVNQSKSVDKTLLPLDRSKLKHRQRIKVNVRKAWSPDDLPDVKGKANQTMIVKEKKLAAISATPRPTRESISPSEGERATQKSSATTVQRFYRGYSDKKYGAKSDVQSGVSNEANDQEEHEKIVNDNAKNPEYSQERKKSLGMVAEWLAASPDESPQETIDNDDNEGFKIEVASENNENENNETENIPTKETTGHDESPQETIDNDDNEGLKIEIASENDELENIPAQETTGHDESPQETIDNDDNEGFKIEVASENDELESIRAQETTENDDVPKIIAADEVATENNESEAAPSVKQNEEILQLESDSTEKITENEAEIANESNEQEASSALEERRNSEEQKLAEDFPNTSANNEAAIKIQTAIRNRLAQKEAEHRDSLRLAEVAPVEPPAERPLSSYRPETGDSSSTFWPSSTPLPGQV